MRELLLLRNWVVLILGVLFITSYLRADPAPPWTLQDLHGKTVNLSDFRGKIVVLDFWATWCPPCRAEIPHFIDLQKQYGDQGLAVIGISLDDGGPDAVADFVKKSGINYTIVLGNGDVTERYGHIQGIPTTFVINQQGNIVSKYAGLTEASVIEGDVKKLLPTTVSK
jgi:thiol-disulfide isomerase/thioredoxin